MADPDPFSRVPRDLSTSSISELYPMRERSALSPLDMPGTTNWAHVRRQPGRQRKSTKLRPTHKEKKLAKDAAAAAAASQLSLSCGATAP